MLIQFHKNQKQMKIFWVGMVKNGCGEPGHVTQKLTVSQK